MGKSEMILELEHITKIYPGVRANEDIYFSLHRGEVKALLGENGAGKSTLIKGIMGIVPYDNGTMRLHGRVVQFKNAHEARKHGINAVFQELSQITSLTVSENIFINCELKSWGTFLNRKEMSKKSREYLNRYGIDVDPDEILGNLPLAKRQLIEIAKATINRPDVLILDEPTSALTDTEAEILYTIIENLKCQGTGIIFISHRLNEISRVADGVSILRDGRNAAELDVQSMDIDTIVHHMVGRELDLYENIPRKPINRSDKNCLLSVNGIKSDREDEPVSFKLYQGEILGIAGLVGSGRSELMQLLFGVVKACEGSIMIQGKPALITNVKSAMRQGIAMIPENRHLQGLNMNHSISDNIVLPVIKNFSRWFIILKRKIETWVEEWIIRLAIKTDNQAKLVNQLSGGNQQKVVIAKWLSTNPRVLIVDELTAGIDVGSKSEIHQKIRELADDGLGVILVSSDMQELLALSDRIAVMNRNRMIANLPGKTTQQEIMSIIMKDNNLKKEIRNVRAANGA